MLRSWAVTGLAAFAAACAHPAEIPVRCGGTEAYALVLPACDAELAAPDLTSTDRALLLYRRAVVLTNMRDLDRAIADLDASIALAPNVALAHRLRGYVYWRKRDLAPALANIEAALRLDPNLAMAYYNRGLIYGAMDGNIARTIPEITRAHAIESENPVFLTGLCRARAEAGVELDLALADCNRSLALRPQHSDTLDFRALIALRRGQYEAALHDYDAALALEADLPTAQYGRGLTLLNLGRAEEGRAQMAAALVAVAEAGEVFRDLPGAIAR